jgi:hypothetical protein
MTLGQLIQSLAQRGFTLTTGPHGGFRGYYAQFYKKEDCAVCPECYCQQPPDDWFAAGHGMTLPRAIIMAAKLVLENEKGKVVVPQPVEFK